MRHPGLFLVAALAALPLPAREPAACHCGDDPPILVTGELDYHPLPAGLKIEGADHPDDYAVQAAGRRMNAIVPGLPQGRYTVEIDVAETVCRGRGERVMDILVGRTVLAQDVDLIKRGGGFAQACQLTGTVDYEPWVTDQDFVIHFIGRTNDAVFNAIRVTDADGKVVAALTAAELQAEEPADAGRIPVVAAPAIYRDPAKPRAERIDDLIARMSLREKVAQMLNAAPAIERLGVPAYNYWSEALHGVARAGTATSFPQAIGMAAMWDAPLLHEIADAIATEARAKYADALAHGNHGQNYGLTFWSPNINLFRDPRWGRGQETYGEDPFLTSRLAVAFITGLQGDDPNYYKALACAKHYAVHSGPEPLRHTFDAEPSEQDLYDSYLPHFEAAVREGHVGAVMSAYNRVLGKSATASPFLLTELLRQRWGFTGHVVSDCDAVSDIWMTHKLVATPEEAAALAVKAGCDLNCGSQYYALTRAVKKGLLTEQDIDRALRHIFTCRFGLGMFDPPELVPYSQITMAEVDSPAHAALALKAAEESIVLLKNSGLLPLDRARIKRLAVVGANADSVRVLLGNYNGTPSHPVTVLLGLKDVAGPGIEVTYSRGGPLALHPGETYGPEAPDFQAAVQAARAADVVVYVGGISPQLEGEEMRVDYVGFQGGDRTAIELPAPQLALLQALAATGRPVVLVNCSGSAIALPWAAENLPAIVQAWYPGQAGGTAVARVLFGDSDPGGRLPVTFYRATTDLPPFQSYAMANRTYRFFTGQPLFAFGHGLSYANFRYGAVTVSSADVATTHRITVVVEVANTGSRDGDEVVQVYYQRPGNPDPALPQLQLCAFRRVSVPPGGEVPVELTIPVAALRHWNPLTQTYVVDAGAYELQVGAASDDIRGKATIQLPADTLPADAQL